MTSPLRQRIVSGSRIIHRVNFDSLKQCAAWAGDDSGKRWSINVSHTQSSEHTRFTGSKSFAHAMSMVERGWAEGRQKLVKNVEHLSLQKDLRNIPSFLYDVGGARPEVPLAVAGDPCCMWNANPAQQAKAPVLRFIISGTANCSWSADAMIRWGSCILSVVDSLENSGQCSIELSLFIGVKDYRDNRRLEFTTCLKEAGSHIDFDVMAFALAHPSMFRRIGFGCMERVHEDDMEDAMSMGYGQPSEMEQEDKELNGAHYVPGIGKCGIERELLESSGNEKELFGKVMEGFQRLVDGKSFAEDKKKEKPFDIDDFRYF